MIQNAIVEEVAEAIYMASPSSVNTHWDDLLGQRKDLARRQAKAAIAAFSLSYNPVSPEFLALAEDDERGGSSYSGYTDQLEAYKDGLP